MYFTGIADEAARDIDGQIRAHQALGWKFLEARNVGSGIIHDLPDAEFDQVCGRLADSGLQVNCFASTIANWGKQITDPFEQSLAETRRAIARMQRLGTRLIRIMSYAVLPDRTPDDQLAEERFARLRVLHQMFTDAGITPVHENCMNYGGMGWPYMLRLIENVPGLKIVFDTGNPVFTDDRSKPEPYPKQSAWEFYEHVRDHIAYVHIKDGRWDLAADKIVFTWPGEGQGDVRRILADLLARGYEGGVSIEPHMHLVFHEQLGHEPDAEQIFNGYVEYGRRLMKIVEGLD